MRVCMCACSLYVWKKNWMAKYTQFSFGCVHVLSRVYAAGWFEPWMNRRHTFCCFENCYRFGTRMDLSERFGNRHTARHINIFCTFLWFAVRFNIIAMEIKARERKKEAKDFQLQFLFDFDTNLFFLVQKITNTGRTDFECVPLLLLDLCHLLYYRFG